MGVRPLAILIMLVGVAGFLVARLMFGEQVLCLLGSTMVTFGGLGLIVAARRYGWGQYAPTQPGAEAEQRQPGEQIPMVDSPAVEWMEQPGQRQAAGSQSLHGRAEALFRGLGAAVSVEASRPGRSILRIEAQDGRVFTAIILDAPDAVDVAEARALLALVGSSGSQGGFLIAGDRFTPRAVQWAQGKPIQLVEAGRLNSIPL